VVIKKIVLKKFGLAQKIWASAIADATGSNN